MNPEKLAPSTQTVYQHLNNIDAKSKAQVAANQQILNTIEEATLVSFIQKLATHAFSLGHQQIMLHALQFAQIHHPTHESMGYSWLVLLIPKLSSKEPEGSLDQEP